MIYKETEVQELQNRVSELERQLAEAQAAISVLTSPRRNVSLQHDQTLRKMEQQWEAERANFLANEERLQSALMIVPYPLMIRRDDGRVMMINTAWTDITGYTLDDIPTIAEWTRKACGEHAPEQQSSIDNEDFSRESITKWGEIEVTTRSGQKRIWDFSTAPLGFDEHGRKLVMTMAVDVTDRKSTEEGLRAVCDAAIWLARLPGENPNPVARVSQEGIILYHNSPAANLPGWTCAVNEPVPILLRSLVDQALTQGQIIEQEVTLGTRIYSLSAVPILQEGYANLYGRDITEQRKAEKALRESEERFAKAFHASPSALVISRQEDGRIETVNDTFTKFFGYDEEEVIGKTSAELGMFVNPQDRREAVRRLHIDQFVRGFELDVRLRSGEVRNVILSIEPMNVGGEDSMLTMIQDITLSKRAEEALRKRESVLAQAGEMAHLGAWEIEFYNWTDINANPLSWSDEVYRIFGYAPGEVEPSNELFFEHVHPDDRLLVQESVAQAIATRQPYRIEHRIRPAEGGERIVQEHAEVYFDESGRPLRIVGAVQDITERKRAEEALHESEERFHSLADSMPQLIWTALPDGTVDYYNSRSQEYWGIKQVMPTVWEWAPVLHPEDRQPTIDAWLHCLETGEIYQAEHRVRMADGSFRWHLSRGIPVFDGNGRIIRWFGTATDIHDLKLAEEQSRVYAERLEQSNKELEHFAFMASHDLQEPLRKIEMFGDLLLDEAEGLNDQGRDYLNRMRNAAERMHAMVDGLLKLSRVTTQGQPFVRVNLSQVCSEVLSDLGDQIRRTNGRLEFNSLPVLDGDPLQLRQLIQNLIGNALKYHQPETPPEVKVYAKQLPGKVQIFVEDKGIGFEQKDAARIFQPFERLVGRSQYEGSGMGLAICRRIVERHGGEITARSQPDVGTTFIVTLPVHHSENTGAK